MNEMNQVKVLEPVKPQLQLNLNQPAQRHGSVADRSKQNERKHLTLRFSPTAWAKLLFFRDKSDNEIGGFGITEPHDLLFVREFATVKQEVTGVSVRFDDQAVADYFDQQVDLGRKPEQFARIWLHTHPGDCPQPSGVDEETFVRVFGKCQWAVMFIVAQNSKTYARLSFNIGPGGQILIPVEIDFGGNFGPTDRQAWATEYTANIKATGWVNEFAGYDDGIAHHNTSSLDVSALPYDLINEFEKLDPVQRQLVLDELADRPELWDPESEVMSI